jgi:hypothetical protein
MSASARGIPTAQPTIKPVLEPEPELPDDGSLTPAVLAVGSGVGVGVTRTDLIMVEIPADPEETLVTSDTIGDTEDGGADEAVSVAVVGASVFDGEFPLPEPLARPVKDASVG